MTAVDRLGSAYELYRRTAASRSAILLLLANLIPLAGVLFFGWSLITILVLYWIENGIVGLWNIPKILLARGPIAATPAPGATEPLGGSAGPVPVAAAAPSAPPAGGLLGPTATARLSAIPRAGLATFFAVHYGMFWFVHGIFVFLLPNFAGAGATGDACLDAASSLAISCRPGPFGELVWPAVVVGAIALFLSHGASFLLNYVGRGEYLVASPSGQMGAVYGRVVVLHMTIILGSFVIAFVGAPIGALLVLVVLKTGLDLGLHLRERRRAAPPLPPAGAQAADLPASPA